MGRSCGEGGFGIGRTEIFEQGAACDTVFRQESGNPEPPAPTPRENLEIGAEVVANRIRVLDQNRRPTVGLVQPVVAARRCIAGDGLTPAPGGQLQRVGDRWMGHDVQAEATPHIGVDQWQPSGPVSGCRVIQGGWCSMSA